ncbi:MAG: 50S ribosomal protein L29 [Verrucomicrobiota bacterium]
MKITELRELTVDELSAQARDLKLEIVNLRVQQASGQLENPARIRTVRREIARIETVISERQQAQAQEAATATA